MGNKSNQRSSSSQKSNSYSSSLQIDNKDSRQYSNTDSRQYSTTDSRQYSNIDSRDMSTNVNNVDNRNISDIALDCGINPTDVENYTNDESININQDNSQNIVVSGDGNTLDNITQKMNLTSYGPNIQKCMQDAVSKMASANKTELSAESSNVTGSSNTSDNTSSNASDNSSSAKSDNSTKQSSQQSQSTDQGSTQSNSASQTAGMGSFNFDFSTLFIIVGVIVLFGILGTTVSNIMSKKRDD